MNRMSDDRVYLDVVTIGEHHGQTVDAQTPASCRRQTVFQCHAEILIDQLCFIVSGVFVLKGRRSAAIDRRVDAHLGLHFEHFTLNERIVQFSVGVARLLVADEQFEAFGQSGDRTMAAGERRDVTRRGAIGRGSLTIWLGDS